MSACPFDRCDGSGLIAAHQSTSAYDAWLDDTCTCNPRDTIPTVPEPMTAERAWVPESAEDSPTFSTCLPMLPAKVAP